MITHTPPALPYLRANGLCCWLWCCICREHEAMSNTILDHILNDPENDIDLQVGLDALPLFLPGLCLTLNPDPIMSSSAILALVVDNNR